MSLDKMKCGGCGCETCTVEVEGDRGSFPFFPRIVLTCTQCKSETDIKISPARIDVGTWRGEGGFCNGWSKR